MAAWVVLCGLLPLVAVWYSVGNVVLGDAQAVDFRIAYYPAAEAVLDRGELYPQDGLVPQGDDGLIVDYVYPPLTAVLVAPLTVVRVSGAESVFVLLLVLFTFATLAVLGVHDWRCYGLALLWLPVTDGISTGNMSVVLAFAAALAWRLRDRPLGVGASIGVSLGMKILLWPLVAWLAGTRRLAAAWRSVAIGVAAAIGSWAVVGFEGLGDYPDLARSAGDKQDHLGYTVYALGLDLGLTSVLARALWLALAVSLLAATVVAGRRGHDRRAFVLALATTIAFSPVVWLHYFSLLLVAVAIAQPRLGALWFVGLPLQVVVTTRVYNGSTFQTAAVLVLAALVVVLALRRLDREPRQVALSSPAAARS
jgi:alpha-1,2-mannosyltransferase